MSSTRFGKLNGSLPEGFMRPNITSASALPHSFPRYHAWIMERTSEDHGIDTADPYRACQIHRLQQRKVRRLTACITTTIFGFASANAAIVSSCRPGRAKLVRSKPSLSHSGVKPATNTTASTSRASETASEIAWTGSIFTQPPRRFKDFVSNEFSFPDVVTHHSPHEGRL